MKIPGLGLRITDWRPVLSSGPVYDPDAVAFFTAAGITDVAEKNAFNQLTLDLKAFSLWGGSKIRRLFPFLGTTADQQKWDAIVLGEGSFVATCTHNSNGFTPDGISGYFNTGYSPTSELSSTSHSLFVYSRTDVSDGSVDINSKGGPGDFHQISIKGANLYDLTYNGGVGRIIVDMSATPSTGLFVGTRTGANAAAAYRNGVVLNSGVANAGLLSDQNVVVGCYGLGETAFSIRNYAIAGAGFGLDATDNANLYTAIQTFQTALGRQV